MEGPFSIEAVKFDIVRPRLQGVGSVEWYQLGQKWSGIDAYHPESFRVVPYFHDGVSLRKKGCGAKQKSYDGRVFH